MSRLSVLRPNTLFSWTVYNDTIVPEIDPLTCEPIEVEDGTETIMAFMEMNVAQTPLNAEPWDRDDSSEYLRLNLSGHFVNEQGRGLVWPETLNPQQVIQCRYQINTTHYVEFDCYVFPMGTTGIRRPLRRFGDALRISGRLKAPYVYNPGQFGECGP